MPYTLEVSVRVLDNGQDLPGSPFVYQTTVAELDSIQIQKTGSDGASYFTFGRLATVNSWLLMTDTQVQLGFLGNALGLILEPGGLVLMLGVSMGAGATSNPFGQ